MKTEPNKKRKTRTKAIIRIAGNPGTYNNREFTPSKGGKTHHHFRVKSPAQRLRVACLHLTYSVLQKGTQKLCVASQLCK